MRRKFWCWLSVCGLLVFAATASAQPTINGTLVGDESFYGPALSIQNTDTQFGNATNGDPRVAMGGSELDQVFGTVSGDRLYLLVTGNLESNFNKLEVFIDSEDGGVNTIDGLLLPDKVDGFCCTVGGGVNLPADGQGALQRMSGLAFDAGFTADHYLTFTNGTERVGSPTTNFWAITAHYAQLNQGTLGMTAAAGMQLNAFGMEPGLLQGELVDKTNNGWDGPDDPNGTPPEHEFVEPISSTDPTNDILNHRDMENTIGLRMAIDNSNVAGVEGAGGPPWDTIGDPQNVNTGIEFSIPLTLIGSPAPGSEIKVTAFINGTGHDVASNQFSGVGVLEGNLGGGFALGDIDMTMIDGDQFVTIIVPESAVNGDFNGDGLWNLVDIDDLVAEIVAGTNNLAFDMNGDGVVTDADITDENVGWLAVGGANNADATGGNPFLEGDADLNGAVDVSDFNTYNNNKFTSTAAWSLADFNADGNTDVSDFNIFNNNKFTSSMNGGVSVVPEPGSLLLLALGAVTLIWRRRAG